MHKVDMRSVIQDWFKRDMIIGRRLDELSSCIENMYFRGTISLLKNLKLETEFVCLKSLSLFSGIIDISSEFTMNYEDVETEESDTETEIDFDSEYNSELEF